MWKIVEASKASVLYIYIDNAKLTYYNHFNKNVKHLDLRITKIWVKQK